MNELPLDLESRSRHKTCCCNGSCVHHGVCSAIAATFDGCKRIEWQPRGVHAQLSPYLLCAQSLAYKGENEWLGDAHDGKFIFRVTGWIDVAVGRHHTHTEQFARYLGQR